MWTPLAKSIRCRTWKETGDDKRMEHHANLLLFWRLDINGRLRYLDAYGDDVQAVLCFGFEP